MHGWGQPGFAPGRKRHCSCAKTAGNSPLMFPLNMMQLLNGRRESDAEGSVWQMPSPEWQAAAAPIYSLSSTRRTMLTYHNGLGCEKRG